MAYSYADWFPVVSGLYRAVRRDCPGKLVVGKGRSRTDEDAVLKARGLVDKRIVLDLAAVTHPDPRSDIRASPDDARSSDRGVLSDLG